MYCTHIPSGKLRVIKDDFTETMDTFRDLKIDYTPTITKDLLGGNKLVHPHNHLNRIHEIDINVIKSDKSTN